MDRGNYGVHSKAVTMTGFNKTRTTAVRLSKAVGDPGAGNENGGGMRIFQNDLFSAIFAYF